MDIRQKIIVAAFDFDGTLTNTGSFLPFVIFSFGKRKTLWILIKHFISILKWAFGRLPMPQITEELLLAFFKGKDIETYKKKGHDFAYSAHLAKILRKDALARLNWHQRQGHRCILVTNSLDIYAQPWGSSMGFSDTLASNLQVDANGVIISCIQCYGNYKVERLKALLLPRDNYVLYAYGDGIEDMPMLKFADFPYYKQMPKDTP